MKSISIDQLADLLQSGLSEEVRCSGNVAAYGGAGIRSCFFSYEGNFSLEVVDVGTYRLSTEGGAILRFIPREKSSFDSGDADGNWRARHKPLIVIPLDITPEAQLVLSGLTGIKY